MVHDAPKPPPERMTMTLPMLRAADRIVVLASGAAKARAVAALLEGPSEDVPASLLAGDRLELIVDEDAARSVPSDRRA
jgi:6-phosphogluconolactonase